MMKKLFLIMVLTCCCVVSYADKFAPIQGCNLLGKTEWTPLQLSFWPISLVSEDTPVYGLDMSVNIFKYQKNACGFSVGLLTECDNFAGISCNVLLSGIKKNYGLNIGGLLTLCTENNGICIAAVNLCQMKNSSNFLQIGIINMADDGLQIGLLNHNPNALIPWMPLFNYSSGKKSLPPRNSDGVRWL